MQVMRRTAIKNSFPNIGKNNDMYIYSIIIHLECVTFLLCMIGEDNLRRVLRT